MSEIIIWTQTHCPLCQQVKDHYDGVGYEERDAEELVSGAEPDRDAMAQLAMQDFQLPLVKVDDEFINVLDLIVDAA